MFAISTRGDKFCNTLFALQQIKTLLKKGSTLLYSIKAFYSIRKEVATKERKFLRYRADLFRRDQNNFGRNVSFENVSISLEFLIVIINEKHH